MYLQIWLPISCRRGCSLRGGVGITDTVHAQQSSTAQGVFVAWAAGGEPLLPTAGLGAAFSGNHCPRCCWQHHCCTAAFFSNHPGLQVLYRAERTCCCSWLLLSRTCRKHTIFRGQWVCFPILLLGLALPLHCNCCCCGKTTPRLDAVEGLACIPHDVYAYVGSHERVLGMKPSAHTQQRSTVLPRQPAAKSQEGGSRWYQVTSNGRHWYVVAVYHPLSVQPLGTGGSCLSDMSSRCSTFNAGYKQN